MNPPSRLSHGHTIGGDLSPTYVSWMHMLARCRNRKAARYGGRGIKVYEHWQSFDAFLADMAERPEGTSIDRLDNAKGYEPGNCRWATAKEQARNRRGNRTLTVGEETLTLAERSGARPDTIAKRIDRWGWSPERAIFGALVPAQASGLRARIAKSPKALPQTQGAT